MALKNIRLEVMRTLEKEVDSYINQYLIPVEEIWQPTDLLPDFQKENYIKAFGEVQMAQGDTLFLNSKYAEYSAEKRIRLILLTKRFIQEEILKWIFWKIPVPDVF